MLRVWNRGAATATDGAEPPHRGSVMSSQSSQELKSLVQQLMDRYGPDRQNLLH